MDRLSPKLYAIRNFGETFTAVFSFLRLHFKVWFKLCLYLILPLSFVQSMATQSIVNVGLSAALGSYGSQYEQATTGFFGTYGVLILSGTIGNLLLISICYSIIKYCHEHNDVQQELSIADLKPSMFPIARKAFLLGLVILISFCLVFSLIIFIITLKPLGFIGIILIPLLFLSALPLILSQPIYIFEDKITLLASIRRAYKLGGRSVFNILSLLIVVLILANILQTITALPWEVFLFLKFIFKDDLDMVYFFDTAFFHCIDYILAVVMNFGSYLMSSLVVLAIAFYYGTLAEKKDGLSVNHDMVNLDTVFEKDAEIDHFENL